MKRRLESIDAIQSYLVDLGMGFGFLGDKGTRCPYSLAVTSSISPVPAGANHSPYIQTSVRNP